jgi:hypothetical protein
VHMHASVACGGGSPLYMHLGSSCCVQTVHASHVGVFWLKLSCACGSFASVMIGIWSSGVESVTPSGGSCG